MKPAIRDLLFRSEGLLGLKTSRKDVFSAGQWCPPDYYITILIPTSASFMKPDCSSLSYGPEDLPMLKSAWKKSVSSSFRIPMAHSSQYQGLSIPASTFHETCPIRRVVEVRRPSGHRNRSGHGSFIFHVALMPSLSPY